MVAELMNFWTRDENRTYEVLVDRLYQKLHKAYNDIMSLEGRIHHMVHELNVSVMVNTQALTTIRELRGELDYEKTQRKHYQEVLVSIFDEDPWWRGAFEEDAQTLHEQSMMEYDTQEDDGDEDWLNAVEDLVDDL